MHETKIPAPIPNTRLSSATATILRHARRAYANHQRDDRTNGVLVQA